MVSATRPLTGRRLSYIAVPLATAIAGLGVGPAAVAAVGAQPARPLPAQPARAGVVVVDLCLDVDLARLVRLQVKLGACRPEAPPTPPPAPPPPPTSPPAQSPRPKPPSPRPPAAAPAQPRAPQRARTTAPPRVRASSPAERTPTRPSWSAQPPYTTVAPQGVVRGGSERLGTIMFLVVLSIIIASGTGMAFAAVR